MIVFFPNPYPDELLYSILARYHARSGNQFFRTTMKDLFGKKSFSAVADMPCHIDSLVKRLPLFISLTANDIIINHTLYTYYTAFLPEHEVKYAFSLMKKPYGGSIHLKLGITASTIHVPLKLKYCPECCEEDIKHFGEYYWHRLHNTPGVLVCSRHKTVLIDSSVCLHTTHRQGYFTANSDTCPQVVREISSLSNCCIEVLSEIADDIEWLYRNYKSVRNLPDIEQGLRTSYRYYLKSMFSPVKIDGHPWGTFFRKLHEFYGTKVLSLFQSNFDYKAAFLWPMNIVKSHTKTLHPIRHLLLMRFFCGNPKNFIENAKRIPREKPIEKARRVYTKPEWVNIDKCREEWLDLIDKNPGMYKREIMKLNYPLYTKLYRYDHKWLMENSPKIVPQGNTKVVDWETRDKTILKSAKEAVKKMFDGNIKPTRVTINSVGKKTGWFAWLEKHPDKLPLSIAYMRRVSESTVDFQVRRVKWAAREINHQGISVIRWKIERIAGLPAVYSPEVGTAIRKEIDRYIKKDAKIKAG